MMMMEVHSVGRKKKKKKKKKKTEREECTESKNKKKIASYRSLLCVCSCVLKLILAV